MPGHVTRSKNAFCTSIPQCTFCTEPNINFLVAVLVTLLLHIHFFVCNSVTDITKKKPTYNFMCLLDTYFPVN